MDITDYCNYDNYLKCACLIFCGFLLNMDAWLF